ncbi:SDR family NAD(P)-dependent oxidoreductase [Sphaerotilus sp.]|uniref:SDR family NAD(P)-dependent oxidoreductase n=1 Tax=Sphaerotilus sp. TaxID=2093942 RepID=UPI0025F42D0E|nr:SDR family NAD(P)-dependent oxidoreductase [Sphaerotilus sp.]
MNTRLALITGGSRGLGRALVMQLQADGWRVVELSRSAPTADSVRVDLAQPAAVAQALGEVLAGIDPLSVAELLVVHNAGTVQPVGPAANKPAGALIDALNVNLVSGIAFLAAAMVHFQCCPGRKVVAHISSGAAVRAHAGLSLYSAAKAGMDQFLRVVAAEQKRQAHPFRALSIDPGALDTGMQATLRNASPDDYPGAAAFAQRQRDGALGRVEDVAASVLCLLADDALANGERHHVRTATT